jgi:hypothetical protein
LTNYLFTQLCVLYCRFEEWPLRGPSGSSIDRRSNYFSNTRDRTIFHNILHEWKERNNKNVQPANLDCSSTTSDIFPLINYINSRTTAYINKSLSIRLGLTCRQSPIHDLMNRNHSRAGWMRQEYIIFSTRLYSAHAWPNSLCIFFALHMLPLIHNVWLGAHNCGKVSYQLQYLTFLCFLYKLFFLIIFYSKPTDYSIYHFLWLFTLSTCWQLMFLLIQSTSAKSKSMVAIS